MRQFKRSTKLRLATAAGVVGLAAAAVVAEDLYVQRDRLELTNQPSPLADVVEAVPRNARVKVLERTEADWLKVQTAGGKQGYANADALGGQPASGTAVAVNSPQDANAPVGLDVSLAGKGALERDADAYSRQRSYDPAALNRLIAMNQTSDDLAKQWQQFCKDGKVGDYKGK